VIARGRHNPRNKKLALLGATVALIVAMLACTSNDSLFIKLTATPVPTVTPTPLAGVDTRYKKGDQLYAVDVERIINLGSQAGDTGGIIGAGFLSCFRNSPVTVQDISRSVVDSSDPDIYYQVDCGQGGSGWLPQYKLTPYNPAGGTAVVKSPDGKGAPLYKDSTIKAALASDKPCPDGTQVKISDATRNIDLSGKTLDKNIYLQVQCGDASGWVVDSMLAPSQ
jgi:hypothetical protein